MAAPCCMVKKNRHCVKCGTYLGRACSLDVEGVGVGSVLSPGFLGSA